jgi:Mrp family chromosome partitioning ATPase
VIISVGEGKKNPAAVRLPVSTDSGVVKGFAAALSAVAPGVERWVSTHSWKKDSRTSDEWSASLGVAVDVDYTDGEKIGRDLSHVHPPVETVKRIDEALSFAELPGSVAHQTPRGLRIYYVFDDTNTDATLQRSAADGAISEVEEALRRMGVDGGENQPGYVIDKKATRDLARLMFAPFSTVDGVERRAKLVTLREDPYSAAGLSALAPKPRLQLVTEAPKRATPPSQKAVETDFNRAVEEWNRDHPRDYPLQRSECPVCGSDHGFGQCDDNPMRWSCFSGKHPDYVGLLNKVENCVTGDALDLEVYARGLLGSQGRGRVLRDDGYLANRNDYRQSPPPQVSAANAPEREPGSDDDVVENETVAPPRGGPAHSLAELVDLFGAYEALPRMPTGLPTLDRDTSGGLRPGLHVVGGAPSAGKTTLAIQLAIRWALAGYPVSILAYDQKPHGLIMRIGQILGFNRDLLSVGDLDEVARVKEALAPLANTLSIYNALAERTVVSSATSYLLAKAAAIGKTGVLMVDSAQRARTGDDRQDTREAKARVDAVMHELSVSASNDLLVLCTSEVNRGFYRDTDKRQVTAMAAFKESGAIEYDCDSAIVLTSVADQKGIVDVEVPKNRDAYGATSSFRLRLDFKTAMFTEISKPVEEGKKKTDPADQLRDDMTRVRTALAENPKGVNGMAGVFLAVKNIDNKRKTVAFKALQEQGAIREEAQLINGRNRVFYFLNPSQFTGPVTGPVAPDEPNF